MPYKDKEKEKAWKNNHKEKKKIDNSIYRKEHKEQLSVYDKVYQANHKTEKKEYKKQHYQKNKEEILKKAKIYRDAHKEDIKSYKFKYTYGITIEQRDEMIRQQNNKCGICQKTLPIDTKQIHIDHNHKTNTVRAILCQRCNSVLGFSQESIDVLESTIKYIRRYNNV